MFTKRFTPPLTLYTNHQPHPSLAVYHNPSLSYCIAPTMAPTMVHYLPCCILQASPFHIAYLQPLTPLLYISVSYDPIAYFPLLSHNGILYRPIPPSQTAYLQPLPTLYFIHTYMRPLSPTLYANPSLLCCTVYTNPLPPMMNSIFLILVPFLSVITNYTSPRYFL